MSGDESQMGEYLNPTEFESGSGDKEILAIVGDIEAVFSDIKVEKITPDGKIVFNDETMMKVGDRESQVIADFEKQLKDIFDKHGRTETLILGQPIDE